MEDRDGRPERGNIGVEAGAPDAVEDEGRRPDSVTSRRPTHARARIQGVEAGVAAGLVQPPSEIDEAGVPEWPIEDDEPEQALEGLGGFGSAAGVEPAVAPSLPDWRDPPTREVPRVLLDDSSTEAGPSYPGPVWREDENDWDDDDRTFAEIVDEGGSIADHGDGREELDPFGFDFTVRSRTAAETVDAVPEPVPEPTTGSNRAVTQSEEVPAARPAGLPGEPSPAGGDDQPPSPSERPPSGRRPAPGAPRRSGRGVHRARVTFAGRGRHDKASATVATAVTSDPAPTATPPAMPSFPRHSPPASPPEPSSKRNPVVATVTGLAAGAAVLALFYAGPPFVLALVTVALVAAAAECYQVLRRARYRPAVIVGLLGVLAVAVAGYERGTSADLVVGAAVVVASLCWYVFNRHRRAPVASFAATVTVWAWIGLLGGFATILISPRYFPHRHGLAYLLGMIVATVAYDVGGYAFGSWIGTRRLAPSISPNKTLEGLLGGCFAAIALSVAVVGHLHPWTVPHALALGIVVAVFAPLGDLAESMVKRDLGVKDMSSVLPAHGGILDRIDALLFVLPAAYCLVRLFHG